MPFNFNPDASVAGLKKQEYPDAPKAAPQPQAAPPVGPTGFWSRIQHAGATAVNVLETPSRAIASKAYSPLQKAQQKNSEQDDTNQKLFTDLASSGKAKFGIFSKGQVPTSQLPSETAQTTKDVTEKTKGTNPVELTKTMGKELISAPVGLAKDTNKELIQPAFKQAKEVVRHPSEILKGSPEGNASEKQTNDTNSLIDTALKSGKISKPAAISFKAVDPSVAKQGLDMLNSGKSQKEVYDFIRGEQQKKIKTDNEKTTRIGAEALGTAALLYGGGEAKGLLTGTEAVVKGGIKNIGATMVADVSSKLQKNPNATAKELTKDLKTDAAFGTVATLLGTVGGKVLEDTKTIIGKNPEVNNLLKNTAATKLLQKGEDLNKPVKIGVQGVETGAEKIGVKTPVRPGIKEVSETSKINVRTPDQMSGQEYVKQLTKISKSYDKATGALKDLTPAEQKIRQPIIDRQHQEALGKLNDDFNKPSLTKPKAPQKLESKTTPAEKTTGGVPRETQPKKTPVVEATSKTSIQPVTEKLKISKPTIEGEQVSGSALRSEQKAIKAGLTKEFEGKATYNAGSYDKESANAAKLVHDDPNKAMDIAMSRAPGNNTLHEAAVYHAVENNELAKAAKTGDYSTVQQLVSSPRHSDVSEAAQKLGSEGYYAQRDNPIKLMRDVADTKAAAATKRLGQPVDKVVNKTVKEAAAHIKGPTKSEWTMFVESVKC